MNPSQLVTTTFDSHIEDARRRAQASRHAAEARSLHGRRAGRPATDDEHVTIRPAVPRDRAALEWLAELDGGRTPTDALVAEVRGEIVAAIDLRDGAPVADPFRPTADLLTLLRMRRAQLGGRDGHGGGGGRGLGALQRVRALVAVRRHGRGPLAGVPGGGR